MSQMHRNRRRPESSWGADDPASPKGAPEESTAWAAAKCGLAMVVAALLALLTVSLTRGRPAEPPSPVHEVAAVHALLQQQRMPGALRGASQLRLQSAEVPSERVAEAIAAVSLPKRRDSVLWTATLANGDEFKVVDEFVPADCMAQPNTDYDGPAVRWGLHPAPKIHSAAACCQLCKDWKPSPLPCNTWVFCPDPSGLCWSADHWNHTTGECWLKFQKEWDENPVAAESNIAVVARGAYPSAYRDHHKTAPELVAWTSGSIIGSKGRQ